MRRHDLFRHSIQCHEQCVPDPQEDLYSHEDNTGIHHEYIRAKHLNQHFKKYQTFIEKSLGTVEEYRRSLMQKIEKIKGQLDLFHKEVNEKLKQYIQHFDDMIFKDQKDKFIVSTIKDMNFEPLTCFEMSKLIKLTDIKFISSNQNRLKEIGEQKISQIQQQFEELIKRIFQHNKIEVVSSADKNLLNMIKLNESSIIKVENESVASDLLGDLKGSFDDLFNPSKINEQKAQVISMKKKQINQMIVCVEKKEQGKEQNYEIVEEENEETSYYMQNTKVISTFFQKQKTQVKHDPKIQVKLQQKLSKKRYKVRGDSSSKQYDTKNESEDEWLKDDNQQEINSSIRKLQNQIIANTSNILGQCQEQEDFQTISSLDDILTTVDFDDYQFNIRIKVVKVLYYCVIFTRILKVKFIGGDQTGISIFFTNYWSQIKPGCELQLNNCRFSHFKDSIQITNDKDFKRINEGKDTIKVNLDGIWLNEYIKQDLYYCIHDKNCTLIRWVAKKLGKKNSIKISRMIVKVVFILNQWGTGVFCQVGDSSGLMLAYLKKSSAIKSIQQGNVVKLSNITAKRGQEPNKFIEGEVIYIDSFDEGSKVVPFKHEFLQISDKIMSAQSNYQ